MEEPPTPSEAAILLHPQKASATTPGRPANLLPTLLHTPGGLALLELQGTLNMPAGSVADDTGDDDYRHDGDAQKRRPLSIGRLEFPDYDPMAPETGTGWMRVVHLYVGERQRLTGEVKKLPRPLAVVRRQDDTGHDDHNDLSIVDVVHYKLQFAHRPEPMTESSWGTAVAP